MINVLLVTSSVLGEASVSRKIALQLVEGIASQLDEFNLTVRDATALPLISLDYLSSLRMGVADRNEKQQAAAQLGDEIMEEVERAAVIIVTAPMYSYTIPAALKIWIEYLNRPGRAFEHRPEGAVGLLTGKKVCAVFTRGSEFAADDPQNFQENYLQHVFHTFGLVPVNAVLAEGTAHEGADVAIADACNVAEKLGIAFAQEIGRDHQLAGGGR